MDTPRNVSLRTFSPEVFEVEESYESMLDYQLFPATVDLPDDAQEIWLLIRVIRDPEYPYSLAQLRVVSPRFITLDVFAKHIVVQFKPTYAKCSLSSVIGLSIRRRITDNFFMQPPWRLIVKVVDGTHEAAAEITKQLNDKERIAAAMENDDVFQVVSHCIRDPD